MAKRNIIKIDEFKCTGCGLCIPNCPEGAIQIIDNKARLVSDLMCDGLGACLGHCPEGAITVEQREAEAYDEKKVMVNIVKAGENTIKAHLKHLKDHGQHEYLQQAQEYLAENDMDIPREDMMENNQRHQGCPGSRTLAFGTAVPTGDTSGIRPTELTHWPVQLHLMGPTAPHYEGADVVLAADCTAFSYGDFHKDFLKDNKLAIACPKLDDGLDVYEEKIRSLIDDAKINTLTVVIMQVPCCGGLLRLAQQAAEKAFRKIPIKCVVIGIQGEKLQEEWI